MLKCLKILALAGLVTLPAHAEPKGLGAPSSWNRGSLKADDFYYMPTGIGDDFGHQAERSKILSDLRIAKDVGAKFLRFGVSWLEIEEKAGEYDWSALDEIVATAKQEKIRLLPYVCYTPQWASPDPENEEFWNRPPKDPHAFARFMGLIAKRYKGSIDVWGLWNEPDIDIFWGGSAKEYAELVRLGKSAVLKANPKATVFLGGFGNAPKGFFHSALIKEGLIRDFSVVGLHGYPETLNDQRVEKLYPSVFLNVKKALASSPRPIALWLEETGYSDYRFSPRNVTQWEVVPAVYSYEHTPQHQALNLWKQHILALNSQAISLVSWYRIHDLEPGHGVIGDDNNKFFGLVDLKNAPKPAYATLKFFNELFSEPTRTLDAKISVVKNGAHAEIHATEKKSGSVVLTAWLRSSLPSEVSDETGMAKDGRVPEDVSVRIEGMHFTSAEYRDLSGNRLKKVQLKPGETISLSDITGESAVVVILSR